jgi:threonine dehydratase
MLAAQASIDTLVVPVGGGGLIAGMALAAKARNPAIQVIGVQTASFPSMGAAPDGEAVACAGNTIAEGIAVKSAGTITRHMVRELVDNFVLVDESALERAITLFLNVEKTVAEGAGAASLAAVIADPDRFHGRKVGLVLSGAAEANCQHAYHDAGQARISGQDQPGNQRAWRKCPRSGSSPAVHCPAGTLGYPGTHL